MWLGPGGQLPYSQKTGLRGWTEAPAEFKRGVHGVWGRRWSHLCPVCSLCTFFWAALASLHPLGVAGRTQQDPEDVLLCVDPMDA